MNNLPMDGWLIFADRFLRELRLRLRRRLVAFNALEEAAQEQQKRRRQQQQQQPYLQ